MVMRSFVVWITIRVKSGEKTFYDKISNSQLHLLRTFILKVFQTEKLFFINESLDYVFSATVCKV